MPLRKHTLHNMEGSVAEPPFDVYQIRRMFPVLQQKMRGKPLIYLDNAASALKPFSVLKAVEGYNTAYTANINRGVYEFSSRASLLYAQARKSISTMIGGEDGELIFTSGATASLNLAAQAWALQHCSSGDEIVLTAMEHHSNLVPWQQVSKTCGAALKYIPLTKAGYITEDAVYQTIGKKTRMVAVTGMSNVTGYIPPLQQIIDAAHAQNARVLIDAAQYATHHLVDVSALQCDFFAFSGHKMCGPTGIGCLYVRNDVIEEMSPVLFGGDMIQEVRLHDSTWAEVPERFEAGTPNISGAIGMGAAAEYLMGIGMQSIADHEHILMQYLLEKLEDFDSVISYGEIPEDMRGGIFSFNIVGIHPHDLGTLLDQEGIAIRTGFHCAQPLMEHFGVTGMGRVSFYLYNTKEDIDVFLHALDHIQSIFHR